MKTSAVLSPCGLYRYSLSREWGDPERRVLFVMLNPSTADATKDDPTIRRCIGFAQSWGFGALDVCNLFALRSTDPAALYQSAAPTGPDNDSALREAALRSRTRIAAWGTHGAHLQRGGYVADLFESISKPLDVLRLTKDGHPAHPLYLPKSLTPIPWERKAVR